MMMLACLSFLHRILPILGGKAGEREKKDKEDDAACPGCHSLQLLGGMDRGKVISYFL